MVGTLFAFVVGYYLGGTAGETSFRETLEAIQVIRNSQEVKDLVEGGIAIGKDLIRKAGESLVERVSPEQEIASVRRIA